MEKQMNLTKYVLFCLETLVLEVHAEAPVQLWASRSLTDVVLRSHQAVRLRDRRQVVSPGCCSRRESLKRTAK